MIEPVKTRLRVSTLESARQPVKACFQGQLEE